MEIKTKFDIGQEEGIYKLSMTAVSGLEIALLTNANEELIDNLWKDGGVESREVREAICKEAEKRKKSFTEEEAVKE